MGVDPCIHGDHGTHALCSSQIRIAARLGDIVMTVSFPTSSSTTRGLDTTERLVLSLGFIEARLPVALYHSLGAPDWVDGRPDGIYMAKVTHSEGHPVSARARVTAMQSLSFQRHRILPQHCQSVSEGVWNVDYGNAQVHFSTRSRARFHTLEGVNRLRQSSHRWRDFIGFALGSPLCRCYPGSGLDRMLLRRCLQHVRFGRGASCASTWS